MKSFFLFLIVSIFSMSSFASERIEFSKSKVHSLFVFVEALAEKYSRPKYLKQVFDESSFNNSESQKKLEAFVKLDPAFGRHFDFPGLPKERENGARAHDIIITQSAFSKDLRDFRQRTLGILPIEDLNTLFEILTYFEPIYEKLVWKPNQASLHQVVENFKVKSKKWKVDDLFGRSVKFYNSGWPAQQKFHISFYPIPSGAQESNGQSYGAFESVGVITGEKGLDGKFAVAFHEMCHSIYDTQSAEFQTTLSKWFKNHPSPYAKIAYQWLNEALATAVGNGWVYEKITGGPDKDDRWYNHEKINGFAHALYPKVVEYLDAGKSIDEEFVNSAVQTYEKKFPQSLSEFESYMSDVLLLFDKSVPSGKESRRSFRKWFDLASFTSGSPINHDRNKDSIRNNDQATILIITTHQTRKPVEDLEDVVPGISKVVKSAKKEGVQFGFFEIEKRNVIFLLVDDPSRLEKAIQWMGTTKSFEKKNEFISLKLDEFEKPIKPETSQYSHKPKFLTGCR